MNFDNLTHYVLMTDRASSVYPVYLDFTLLTSTVFTRMRNSIACVTEIKTQSVETVSEVSQKSSVKIVTCVKRKK